MAISKRRTGTKVPLMQAKKLPQESDGMDTTLRPKSLSEYVGQNRIKEHLFIHMEAAKKRKEPLGHALLHGPPGLGKTTLSTIIAREMNTQIRITSGPAVEKPGDLASLLTNLQKGDILFIDEIHRLRPQIEEVLFSAMEECVLDIMIGKGPTARSVRLNLQPFTLIGATTKAGAVSAPLRDRFLHSFKLQFYSPKDMQHIVKRSCTILTVDIEDAASAALAHSSRATPRVANRLVRAVRDFAQIQETNTEDNRVLVTKDCVSNTLTSLDIDERGLDATDRLLLQTIVNNFQGGPVGLRTLAAILAEDEDTIEDVYEPYLLQQGFLHRTPKGRVATQKTFELLGQSLPKELQLQLLL